MAIETNELIDVQTLSPFKKFIMTIGNLPTSYLESMTYGEMLMWFCNYLQETVIPTVNNNALAVEELQNLYEELKDYVDNYFENLNVQNEINNKLDQMASDGTLYNIIRTYTDPIIAEQNTKINQIESAVNSLASGSPLVASSVDEMTDTTKTYVNTTDGKWYYYDGDSWEIGGTYQSTGIGDGTIDILMLNDELKDNLSVSFSQEISLGNDLQGYLSNSGGSLSINTSSTEYLYNIVSLSAGKIYLINAYNYYSMNGFYIVNSSNEIILDSHELTSQNPTNFKPFEYIFRCNDSTLKLYFNKNVNNPLTLIQPMVRTLNDISNKLKVNTNITELKTFEDGYIYFQSNDVVRFVSYSGIDCVMYSIEKGKKYHFKGKNYLAIHGLVVTDYDYLATYKSNPTGQTGNVDYTWTAESDGFAFCATHDDYELTCVMDTLNDIADEIIDTVKFNKTGFTNWIAIGDSITEVNFRALHNYLYWIKQDIPSLNITNLGVSGSGYKNGENTFIDRLDSITSYNLNNTIVTVMGSINDIQYVGTSLGSLGDTTTDTLYGCMYTFFNTLFSTYTGVRIGCISPINWKGSHSSNYLKLYIKALKETCELFNVPFLDMTISTNLRPDEASFITTYYTADGTGNSGQVDTDGVHPNSGGHHLFYGRIKDFINKL